MQQEWYIEETRPRRGWPDEGKVVFDQYMTRYREGLDLVLKGINAEIHAGEKVQSVSKSNAPVSPRLWRLMQQTVF